LCAWGGARVTAGLGEASPSELQKRGCRFVAGVALQGRCDDYRALSRLCQ
jgi:hypothetical protein